MQALFKFCSQNKVFPDSAKRGVKILHFAADEAK